MGRCILWCNVSGNHGWTHAQSPSECFFCLVRQIKSFVTEIDSMELPENMASIQDDQIDSKTDSKEIEHLQSMISQFSNNVASIPSIIDRLKSQKDLHESAVSIHFLIPFFPAINSTPGFDMNCRCKIDRPTWSFACKHYNKPKKLLRCWRHLTVHRLRRSHTSKDLFLLFPPSVLHIIVHAKIACSTMIQVSTTFESNVTTTVSNMTNIRTRLERLSKRVWASTT